MARSYYSTVLDRGADDVWAVIRPFDHYAWAGVPSETVIEAGKRGDQVSAVRRVAIGDKIIRQALLAHSDAERALIARNRSRLFVGNPATVRQKLEPLIAESRPDELMVITAIYDHEARRKSYSLLAEAFGLAKKEPV